MLPGMTGAVPVGPGSAIATPRIAAR